MVHLLPWEIRARPFAHAVADPLVDRTTLSALRDEFPDTRLDGALEVMGGRARFGTDNRDFRRFLRSAPAMRSLFDALADTRFCRRVATQLMHTGRPPARRPASPDGASRASPDGTPHPSQDDAPFCIVEMDRLRVRLARSRRYERRRARLVRARPHRLRLYGDVSRARDGYGREVHADLPNRFLAGALYLDDPPAGAQGGDLLLHARPTDAPGDPRLQPRGPGDDAPVAARFEPKAGRAVFFLSTNDSYHSVARMQAWRRPRRFLYFGWTSEVNGVWKRQA